MAENTTHPLSKRVRWDELHRQISKLAKDDRVQALDRLEDRAVAIVNPERQIVYLNAACARFFDLEDPAQAYGCRHGELLKSIHVNEGEGGCGTSPDCIACGALNAILACQTSLIDARHCVINRQDGSQLLLGIKAIAMPTEDVRYTMLCFKKLHEQ
ncbi:hypothetical protein [Coraliomargarita akajimensis]|nr:hypothetical protein [Coraliomargarita akajimensis]